MIIHKSPYVISVLKKAKHRVVETLSSNTADALGLSRAILCNGKYQESNTAGALGLSSAMLFNNKYLKFNTAALGHSRALLYNGKY